jgi:hypothetical protein
LPSWTKSREKSEWVKNEWLMARSKENNRAGINCKLTTFNKPLVSLGCVTFTRKGILDFFHTSELRIPVRGFKNIREFSLDYDFNIITDNFHVGFNHNSNFTSRDDDPRGLAPDNRKPKQNR